jgi:hypothetical protein
MDAKWRHPGCQLAIACTLIAWRSQKDDGSTHERLGKRSLGPHDETTLAVGSLKGLNKAETHHWLLATTAYSRSPMPCTAKIASIRMDILKMLLCWTWHALTDHPSTHSFRYSDWSCIYLRGVIRTWRRYEQKEHRSSTNSRLWAVSSMMGITALTQQQSQHRSPDSQGDRTRNFSWD